MACLSRLHVHMYHILCELFLKLLMFRLHVLTNTSASVPAWHHQPVHSSKCHFIYVATERLA